MWYQAGLRALALKQAHLVLQEDLEVRVAVGRSPHTDEVDDVFAPHRLQRSNHSAQALSRWPWTRIW